MMLEIGRPASGTIDVPGPTPHDEVGEDVQSAARDDMAWGRRTG